MATVNIRIDPRLESDAARMAREQMRLSHLKSEAVDLMLRAILDPLPGGTPLAPSDRERTVLELKTIEAEIRQLAGADAQRQERAV